ELQAMTNRSWTNTNQELRHLDSAAEVSMHLVIFGANSWIHCLLHSRSKKRGQTKKHSKKECRNS
ncbi:hypothetical protein L9F63_026835, partial [Diploptera punctata]